jgi:two-component system chemotaxis response regulator CheY
MTGNSPDYSSFAVLVVEDQPFVRRTIIQILSQIGFSRISEADNGETGMTECLRANPDIVVCDIEMKPVSGLQFLERLRESTEVKNPRTPVVFLTNHTESDVVKKAMALGVNGFVVKPPSLGALKERVDRLLCASTSH